MTDRQTTNAIYDVLHELIAAQRYGSGTAEKASEKSKVLLASKNITVTTSNVTRNGRQIYTIKQHRGHYALFQ